MVEFFRVFMFLFVLPNVSDETNNTQFFTTIMKDRVSCLARTEARHEIVEGILSPEGMKLYLVPQMLPAATPIMRWPTYNTNALQKTFCSSGARRDDASCLKNRDENTTR